MKLSEILGWKKKIKKTGDDLTFNRAFNAAITACDREIDREALAKALYDEISYAMSWENADYVTHTIYIEHASKLISTMPTWLKPTERK